MKHPDVLFHLEGGKIQPGCAHCGFVWPLNTDWSKRVRLSRCSHLLQPGACWPAGPPPWASPASAQPGAAARRPSSSGPFPPLAAQLRGCGLASCGRGGLGRGSPEPFSSDILQLCASWACRHPRNQSQKFRNPPPTRHTHRLTPGLAAMMLLIREVLHNLREHRCEPVPRCLPSPPLWAPLVRLTVLFPRPPPIPTPRSRLRL